MSEISARKLIDDVYSGYYEIFKKTWNNAIEYEKKFGKNDVRKEFFMNFTQLTVWLLIQFDDFIITQNKKSGKISKYLPLNDESNRIMVEQLDTINRASYLAKCMFDVEHFLKTILDYFGKNTNKGYSLLVDDFCTELNISDLHKIKILKLPASVRNALHNNGYTKYDIENITLRSQTYAARKGDQITFSGWNSIFIIVDEMIDLLIDCVENTKINLENSIPKKPHFIS